MHTRGFHPMLRNELKTIAHRKKEESSSSKAGQTIEEDQKHQLT